jgi:hypothetical protein
VLDHRLLNYISWSFNGKIIQLQAPCWGFLFILRSLASIGVEDSIWSRWLAAADIIIKPSERVNGDGG